MKYTLNNNMQIHKLIDKKQQLEDEVNAELKRMQHDPTCKINDVAIWIMDNVNKLSKLFANRAGRTIRSVDDISVTEVREENESVILNGYSFWHYVKTRRLPPDIHNVSKHITAFDFKPEDTYSIDTYFKATLEFNLAEWPFFVPQALYELIRSDIDYTGELSVRDSHKKSIEILLNRFYPKVSYDLLLTSVDLGILKQGSDGLFDWLEKSVDKTDPSVIVPNDFG